MVQNNTAPEILNNIYKPRVVLYNIRNYNSFERRPLYLVFNGTKTLSYFGPKFRYPDPNEVKQLDPCVSN